MRVRKRLKPNGEDPFFSIPPFLDRRNETDEDRERNRQKWDEVHRQIQERHREERDRENKRIFARAKRARQRKIIREYLQGQRKQAKLERRGRRLVGEREREERDGQVIGALRQGDETVGQINKRTGLSTKECRRSLKRLMRRGRTEQISPRRYRLVTRKRKRLSDVLK